MRVRFEVPRDWCRPADPIERALLWCDSCHYGQVTPLPAPTEVEGLYPEGYFTHSMPSAPAHQLNLESRLRQHLAWRISHEQADSPEFLQSFLEAAAPSRVLDIGCGNGAALVPFGEAGFEVVGVEPDPRALRVAAENLSEVHRGTAEELPESLLPDSFDAVRLCHALEHCTDPGAAIDAAKKVLRPGGVLMLETPNAEARAFDWQGAAWPWSDIPRHLHFFSARSLSLVCEARGFSIERVDYRGFGRQFTNHWLEREKEIHQALFPDQRLPRVVARAWRLLLASLLAPRRRKYDSVFVVARLSE